MTTTTPTTDKGLFAAIRSMGLTISKRDGEYRVSTADGTPAEKEARAYYTDDRDDAHGTAIRMVEDSH